MQPDLLHKLKCVALALLLYAIAAPEAGYAQDADAAQRAFVERYVAALTSQDSVGLKKLYHPASIACINPDNRDYFDFIFAHELTYGAELRGGYTLTRFAPLDANAATASEMGGMFMNPVRPTHQFQIDTPFDSKYHSLTVLRMAAKRDGAWFIVLGCPTAKGIAFFRAQRSKGERQKAHAKQLVAEMPEPLLSEIRQLLAQNRRIEAIKRYQNAANVDLTTATQVVDILANR